MKNTSSDIQHAKKLLSDARALCANPALLKDRQLKEIGTEIQEYSKGPIKLCSGALADWKHRIAPWKSDIGTCYQSSLRKISSVRGLNMERPIQVADQVQAFLLGSSGLLVSPSYHLLRESVFYDEIAVTDLPDLLLPEDRVLSSPCVNLCGVWCFEFWHWVHEYLPRVLLAQELDPNCKILLPESRPSYASESLMCLGVNEEQIVDVGEEALYLENVIIPERLCASAELLKIPSLMRSLRESVSHLFSVSKAERKIYVSRKNAKRRRITNEEELSGLLKSHGFEEVILESLSFSEQVKIHSESKALVGLYGAGFVHSLFLPEKSFVLEIFPKDFKHPNCPYAQFLLEHEYCGIEEIGVSEEFEKPQDARDKDVLAPIEQITDALNYFNL
jgi:hypothetical protein